MRPFPVIAIAAVLACTLGGCAPRPDPAPTALIGMPVPEAAKEVPAGRSYAWYDLTEDILHRDGELIGGDGIDGEDGVIIAVCADAHSIGTSSRIAAGAIPAADYHGAVRLRAEAGEYRALLPECRAE